MPVRVVAPLVVLLAWLIAEPTAAAADAIAEPMHADLVRGLDPEPGELEANVVGIAPVGAGGRGIAWAPEVEWAPTRRAAFELEVPFVDGELQCVKLSAQLTLMRPRRHRPAQGLLVSAGLPVHHDAAIQVTHVLATRLGRRFDLVTQLGPHVTVHASSAHATVGVVASAAGFVALRDGNAVGIETSWTHEAGRSAVEVLPQVHVHAAEHVRVQLGLGARHELGTRDVTAIVGMRVIVER
jgi:hypothetical protein